jgi:hypothetical protein
VAVCSLQFYSVDACLDGIESSLAKSTDDDWNLRSFQGARNFSLDLLEVSCEGRNVPNNGPRGQRAQSHSAATKSASFVRVSDLHDDASPACVNSIGNDAPAGNLFCRIDSWIAGVAMGIRTDCRPFRNDETRRSALSVILGVQRGRHTVGSRTHSRERRQ